MMKYTGRSWFKDGFRNKLQFFVLTHFEGVWKRVQANSFLRKQVNKFLINNAIYKTKTRPYAFSTMASYTSWDSLTDRTYDGRHLPPVPREPASLPSIEDVVQLFERTSGKPILSSKSTLLFSHFAQWFTDGFLRSDRTNPLKNISNHDIDLSNLYGLNRGITSLLRSRQGGKLKSQVINGEEYPCYAFDEDGTIKDEFAGLPLVFDPPDLDLRRKVRLFALGRDSGNVQIGYVMLNTLFLREHNRICDLLAKEHDDWDDERLFQTARNIVIVLLLNIVIEEYINHIAPYHFKFIVDPSSFAYEKWYRQNWMAIEFNLLYRWHSLLPDKVSLGDRGYPTEETFWNNDLLTSRGLGALFEAASLQPAGEIGLYNTPAFLIDVERASIALGRRAQLASYNDYRESCGYPRATAFNQISGYAEIQQGLKRLYGTVDNIEFYVGLFAEDVRKNSVVGPLIGTLVGIDAFSQALTNPLLAETVFNEKTFSSTGCEIIAQTKTLSDILHRNIPNHNKVFTVSLTQLTATPR